MHAFVGIVIYNGTCSIINGEYVLNVGRQALAFVHASLVWATSRKREDEKFFTVCFIRTLLYKSLYSCDTSPNKPNALQMIACRAALNRRRCIGFLLVARMYVKWAGSFAAKGSIF